MLWKHQIPSLSLCVFLFDKLGEGEVTAALFDLPRSNLHLKSVPFSLALSAKSSTWESYTIGIWYNAA